MRGLVPGFSELKVTVLLEAWARISFAGAWTPRLLLPTQIFHVHVVDEAISLRDNHARIQWSDLQEVQASLCSYLEDKEIDEECESHREYEIRVVKYMAKMTHYLESKHVAEINKGISF